MKEGVKIMGIFFNKLDDAEAYTEKNMTIKRNYDPEILMTGQGYLVVSGEVFNKYFKK